MRNYPNMVEVNYAIVIKIGHSIEEMRKEKLKQRGGFKDKLLLISTGE